MKSQIKKLISPRQLQNIRVQIKNIKRILKGEKKVNSKCPISVLSKNKTNTFFGYYDVSPFNSKNNIIYVELPDDKPYVKIVHNTIDNQGKQYVAKSNAWNWQQGCRLRWFANSDTTISYNDFEGNRYFNRIINLKDKTERIIDWPLYDIDSNGKLGLSLNFERLGYLRPGYGYTCKPYQCNVEQLNSEGVFIIDIENNNIIGEVLYPDIRKACGTLTKLEDCYINHLSFSPSGRKFLFFWIEIINGYHKASLVVYGMDEKRIVPLEIEMKASHYVWQDDNTILCTSYDEKKNCRYYKYTIDECERTLICENSLKRDGHPSFKVNPHTLLTDTYPDSQYYQHLYIVNVPEDSKEEIIKIYSDPMTKGEKRTDLHPRFNKDKSLVCFDANTSGHRKLYILKTK